MNVEPVGQFAVVGPSGSGAPPARAFSDVLAEALDSAQSALGAADGGAAAVAAGSGGVMEASLARARADVALEVASAAASRVSGALNTLLQTQV